MCKRLLQIVLQKTPACPGRHVEHFCHSILYAFGIQCHALFPLYRIVIQGWDRISRIEPRFNYGIQDYTTYVHVSKCTLFQLRPQKPAGNVTETAFQENP